MLVMEKKPESEKSYRNIYLPYFTMLGQLKSVSDFAFTDKDEALENAEEMFKSLYPYTPEQINELELEYGVLTIHVKL